VKPNRFVRTVLSAVTALCAVAALPARAAEEHVGGAGTVYSKDQYPYAELVKRPLTLSAGLIQLDVPLEANLSKDHVGEPWWIAPSVDLGVTDDLTVGLYHPIHGICLAGTSNGCREVYDDLGARGTLGLFRDPGGQLAVRAALFAESFKDSLFNGSVGAAYKRTLGNAALVLEADLDIALNKRDERAWNETLNLAAEGQLQLGEGLAVLGRIGYAKPIDVNGAVAAPGHFIPVGFGVEYEPIAKVDVGAEFTFDNLLGENSTADERSGRVFLRMFF
jgi:hypothetical protein